MVKFESGDYGKVELKIGGVVGSSYSISVIKYVKYEYKMIICDSVG